MKIFSLFLSLCLFANIAHADEYDNRSRLAYERKSRVDIQKTQAASVRIQNEFLSDLQRFGQRHSGFAKTPECYDFSHETGGSLWNGNRTRKVCHQGFCAKVTGKSNNLNRYPNNAMWADIVLSGRMISYCKVVLRNGLACRVQNDRVDNSFGGRCLDNDGNARTLEVR